MTRAFNLRDLGGHAVAGGGSVRRGVVYRGASLHRFGDGVPPVKTLIDLRTPEELAADGECPPFNGATVVHRPLLQSLASVTDYRGEPIASFLATRYVDMLDAGAPASFLATRYVDMLDAGAPAVAAVVESLAREEDLPVLFFCAAGKDRTGVVAAIVLSLLGVPDETIAADYELSTEPVQAMAEYLQAAATPLLQAPNAAMRQFLARVREEHGGIEGFARDAGIGRTTVAALRERLVVPGAGSGT